MYSTTNFSPCAACKLLRRKCTEDCVFALYFRADQPQKFGSVHKVFGASNVAKLLNELPEEQREDAVNSLVYEANARLKDPVYGCAGLISILQHKLRHLQMDLYNAKKELATYIGPSAMLPIVQGTENFLPRYQQEMAQAQMMSYNMQQAQMMQPHNMQQPQKLAPYSMQRGQMRPYNMQQAQMRPYNMQQAQMGPYNMQHAQMGPYNVQMMGGLQQTVANLSPLEIHQQQQYQQMMEAEQAAAAVAAVREQERLRRYESQKAFAAKEQELLRDNDLEELEILREQEYYKNHMAQHIAKREQEVILRTYREKQQALAQQAALEQQKALAQQAALEQQKALAQQAALEQQKALAQQAALEQQTALAQQAALAQQQGSQSDLLVGYDIMGQGQGQILSGQLSQMSVPAGMTPALAFGSLEGPYQIQQHTQDDQLHLHHHHHQLDLATQLFLEEQELQALALAQTLLLDPQQEEQQQLQFQLQQHQDGSEEEIGSFDPGSTGPL